MDINKVNAFVFVLHHTNPTFTPEVPTSLDAFKDVAVFRNMTIDEAFALTNHGRSSWQSAAGVEGNRLLWTCPERVRSTAVGDVVMTCYEDRVVGFVVGRGADFIRFDATGMRPSHGAK